MWESAQEPCISHQLLLQSHSVLIIAWTKDTNWIVITHICTWFLWCACEAPELGWDLALYGRGKPELMKISTKATIRKKPGTIRQEKPPHNPQATTAPGVSTTWSIQPVFPPLCYVREWPCLAAPSYLLIPNWAMAFAFFPHAASPTATDYPPIGEESRHSLSLWVTFWTGLCCVLPRSCVSSARWLPTMVR